MAPYRIAVLFEEVQLTDITGIDLFGNCSRTMLEESSTSFPIPPHIMSQAIDMEFLYVSSTLSPARATPNIKIVPTHTYETCPRDIDVVIVGGPLFSHRPEGSLQFFKDVFEKGKEGVVVMTTCTGSMWMAHSGVLDGRKATTNRLALGMAKEMYPNVEWVDKRWVVDEIGGRKGELWTAGGAACGLDMIATFTLQNLPHPLARNGMLSLDVDPDVLGQEYKVPIEETFAKLGPKA